MHVKVHKIKLSFNFVVIKNNKYVTIFLYHLNVIETLKSENPGHLARMEEDRTTLKVAIRPRGKRPVGKRRRWWAGAWFGSCRRKDGSVR